MGAIASQITSRTIVYSTVYSGPDQRKHQSSAALAFVRGIHRWPANSPHKWPVKRKMFPFDGVIMRYVFCHPGASFTNGDRSLAETASRVWHVLVVTPTRNDISTQSPTLIARFMGPTWGPSGADRTHVGPMLVPWTLLSGQHWYS